MAKKTKKARRSIGEIRKEITQKFVDAIANGTPPWRKSWSSSKNSGIPCNFQSGRRYTGMNPFWLMLTSMVCDYESKQWGSLRAWGNTGGHIIKGETSSIVTFFNFIDKTTPDGKVVKNSKGVTEKFPILREFKVFNIDQVQAPTVKTLESRMTVEEMRAFAKTHCPTVKLPTSWTKPKVAKAVSEGIDRALDRYRVVGVVRNDEPDFAPAELLLAKSGVNLNHAGVRACYNRTDDIVKMPKKNTFDSMADYYETAFHELIHWGIVRVERVKDAIKKAERPYDYEELVAEIGACFLTMEVGVPMSDQMLAQSQGYVANWLTGMKNDPKFIFDAATHASAVADFLLAFVGKQNPEFVPYEKGTIKGKAA